MTKLPTLAGAALLAVLLMSSPGLSATAAAPSPAQTELVSISNTTPPVGGDDHSDHPSISADGRYVAFTSYASNLTNETGTSAGATQVYFRDTVTGTTRMVSASPTGVAGNRTSFSPSISGDGRLVAFASGATNLIAGMTTTRPQAFLWSADTGAIEIVSVNNDPTPQPQNGSLDTVVLSADGSTVAWSTSSTNLTSEKTGGYVQVFERDLTDRITALVSRDTTVTPSAGAQSNSSNPTISADGNVIAFLTGARLTSVPTPHHEIYVRDRVNDTLEVASLNTDGTSGVNSDAFDPAISANGRFIAYASVASDAIDQNPISQVVYVRDIQSRTTQIGSVGLSMSGIPNGASGAPSLSADGSLVAYASAAPDVVAEGGTFPVNKFQIYVTDLASRTSVLMSRGETSSDAGTKDSANPTISGDGKKVAFSSRSANLTRVTTPDFSQVYAREVSDSSYIERIGGADRYAVSAAVSASTFHPGVKEVFVASGEGFADALSGSALAGSRQAPLLLVTKNSIPDAVAAELTRLHPQNITVLGGEAAIGASVQTGLQSYATNPVVRIGGADRYAVSAGVSSYFATNGPVAYVASGADFPDALSGSAAAGLQKGPVLLVTKDGIPATIAAELTRLAPNRIVVLGGVNAISDTVATALQGTAPTTRIGGADRFVVSAAVSTTAFAAGSSTVYVASGVTFPDALSGWAAAIATRAPVLLVTPTSIPDAVAAELQRLKPRHIVVLGGPLAVSDAVYGALEGYLAP